ncbi:DUF2887 domain-containing protein [Microcystis aeruginosa]|uniref:DUF2887 domain-containing protein n=1 Tax=Microcystis aeruginosa TaxID=1126 RepID=UPI0008FC0908
MKTDSIFYRLFQTFPESFFDLLNLPPETVNHYQFSSVSFRLFPKVSLICSIFPQKQSIIINFPP